MVARIIDETHVEFEASQGERIDVNGRGMGIQTCVVKTDADKVSNLRQALRDYNSGNDAGWECGAETAKEAIKDDIFATGTITKSTRVFVGHSF